MYIMRMMDYALWKQGVAALHHCGPCLFMIRP